MTTPDGPPEHLRDVFDRYLKGNGWTLSGFVRSIGWNYQHIREVCQGRHALTAELAYAIGQAHPKLDPLDLLMTQAKRDLYELDHGRPHPRRPHHDPRRT